MGKKRVLQFVSDSINYIVLITLLIGDLKNNIVNFSQWSLVIISVAFSIYIKIINKAK